MTVGLRKRDRAREHLIGLIESRAVVDDLIRDGWLIRQHGRGMFVGSPKVDQQIVGGQASRGAAYPPAPGTWTSQVLNHAVIPAGTAIGSRLRIETGTPVLRITRLRLVDGEPIALETIHLLDELVPGLEPTPGSLYALLRHRYDVIPTDAEQIHEAAVADSTEAGLLGVPEGSPILILERLTRDQHGRLFEYTRASYRADRYRVTTHLSLNPPGKPAED